MLKKFNLKSIFANQKMSAQFILIALFLLLLPFSIDNAKYILLGVLTLVVTLSQLYSFTLQSNINWNYHLMGFLAFISLSFCSYFWANNAALSLEQSFIWSIFFLFSIVLSFYISNTAHFIHGLVRLLILLFLAFIIFHLIAFQINIGFDSEWNAFMSKNRKYTSSLLTVMSPYLLFYSSKSQFVRFLKIIAAALLLIILFLTGARGALLAFSFVIIIKFWHYYYQSKFRLVGVLAGLFVIVSSIYVLNTSQASSEFLFVEEYRKELDSRILMNQNSIASFVDNKIVGTGAGSWYHTIYSYGVNNTPPFNDSDEFIRYRSHNLYFKILVEFGLAGAVIFFGTLFSLLFQFRHRWTELTGYDKAAWASLTAYLIVAYFYATAISYEYFFSGIELVGVISVSILLSRLKKNFSINSILKIPFIVLVIGCIIWFVISRYNFSKYQDIKQHIELQEYQEAIEDLEKIYHPKFRTTFGNDEILPLIIANQYKQLGNLTLAEKYYLQAHIIAPYNEELLLDFAIFLKEQNRNEYKIYVDKLVSIQQNALSKHGILQK